MLSRRQFLKFSLTPFLYGLIGQAQSRAQSNIKGIVIGGGIAGLTVARALTQAGMDITVLEARDRTGGRIWTDRSFGQAVDMGASWIHGTDGNPITELARNIDTFATSAENTYVLGANGAEVSDSALETLSEELELFMEAAEELAEELDADIPLSDAVRIILEGEPVTPLRNWGLVTEIELDSAASLDRLSLFYTGADDEFDGDEVVFPGGYDQIVDLLAADLDIRLNQIVRIVEYASDGVRVTTDTDVFEADGVVVTLPLGVLKAGRVQFSPSLPNWKQNAINRLDMGRLNKIALRFPSVFWQPDADFIGYVSETRGEFPTFLNQNRFSDIPMLMSFVGGDFARALENLSDEETQARVMNVLRRIYGASSPDPNGLLISRWGQDPFALGSYSYLPVGATPDDYNALAEPIADRVFFAGEATNSRYPATVHGAYLSGLREAERILNL